MKDGFQSQRWILIKKVTKNGCKVLECCYNRSIVNERYGGTENGRKSKSGFSDGGW